MVEFRQHLKKKGCHNGCRGNCIWRTKVKIMEILCGTYLGTVCVSPDLGCLSESILGMIYMCSTPRPVFGSDPAACHGVASLRTRRLRQFITNYTILTQVGGWPCGSIDPVKIHRQKLYAAWAPVALVIVALQLTRICKRNTRLEIRHLCAYNIAVDSLCRLHVFLLMHLPLFSDESSNFYFLLLARHRSNPLLLVSPEN